VKPYDRVLSIVKHYLGPAAEAFLARQCQVALKREASAISSADFKALGSWVEVSACRFIESPKALEMGKRIASLPQL
jgi:hypothetical protein